MVQPVSTQNATEPTTVAQRDKQQQRTFALIVGIIAVALPSILLLGPMLGSGCPRYSISHFYYSPFYGGIFIGFLTFIGTFLLVYRGTRDETYTTTFAGLCAFGVAFLPTGGHGCLRPMGDAFRARAFLQFNVDDRGIASLKLSEDERGQLLLQNADHFTLLDEPLHFGLNFTDLHYLSAAGLFFVLLYFCFVVFVRQGRRHTTDGVHLTTIKKVRNTIYVLCGSVIYLSILNLGLEAYRNGGSGEIYTAWNLARSTFWWEAVALWAFGISWLVKGRFVPWLIDDSEKNLPPMV